MRTDFVVQLQGSRGRQSSSLTNITSNTVDVLGVSFSLSRLLVALGMGD